MIAARYARKSNEAERGTTGASESVERQLERSREYGERMGWTVAPDLVYFDDAVSGAHYTKLHGRAQMAADAEVGKGGLASKVLRPGTGTVHPKKRSSVEVHYSGWTTDGKLFDSSRMRGEPTTFPLDAVIKGWTEGIPLMVEGEIRRFWIPEKLAYKGEAGKPAGMLVFDVELLRIE